MRFHHVLALTASVAVASAGKCKPRSSTSTLSSVVSESSTVSETITVSETAPSETAISTSSFTTTSIETTPTPTLPAEPRQICQAKGSRNGAALRSSTKIADNTFAACRDLCLAEPLCKSFSIEIKTGGACSLYDSLLYLDFQEANSGATIYFDADCSEPLVEGPKIVLVAPSGSVPIDSVPSSAGPVASFPEYTPPSIVSSDSPPYTPTGPQSKPTDDNEFIATYSYTEYPLPTMVDIGRPPVTTGIGLTLPSDMPCLLSAGADHPFTLLNEDFIPMVTRTGSIGPLLQPTEAPAPDDPILNPLTFTVPGFYLKEVAGASDVYDMVYAETGHYVAMTTGGEVILVDASTGTSFSGDHVTSIFSFDCRGTILISQGGSQYTWSTEGESCSIVPAATPKNNMKTLPVSVPKIQVPDRKRAAELIEKLKARGAIKARVNTDFHEPQCPNNPPGLVSKTKQGYKMGEGNFCEDLSEWWGLSPFDFDTACAIQSLCFDQCEGFSFAGCTAIFSYAMYLTCADNFKDWWDVIKAGACAAQATVFVGLASSSTGQGLYNKAQSAMCRCFCSNPPDTCVYVDGNGDLTDNFYCADLHGSDMLNCGACGGQCGANSACKKGACGCPQDQCGTTCLDFRNNPNNCGACGNVCDPKYCIGGQCYKPSPDECAPDQAVTNNMFEVRAPWFVNWTAAAFPGTTLGTDVVFGASSYTWKAGEPPVKAISVTMTNLPAGGFHVMLTQPKVKVCPGFDYELKFNMGYVNQVNGAGVTSNADCQVRWLTGQPSGPDASDGFRSSPWYFIGASNPTYMTFGPWRVGNVKEGEPGVSKQKANLYVDLTAVISCRTPVGGSARFIMTDVQLNPTGFASSKRSDEEDGAAAGVRRLEQRDSSETTTDLSALFEPIVPGPVQEETFVTVSARRRRL
ncbi:apple-like protein [Achaetomium macrosporum]|uniref:Apple-like protein n=1 Tax=Achaetomium macrosporum TaxID=79813 RepID=A0AAN7HC29_9PEZI|nr:apple-like protein [Achaetomium macrosporum]